MRQQMATSEKLASLGTLAAGVAHEINNPLAIINESAGWLKLILNREEMAHMPRKQDFEMALNKIETGVDRAKRITHQLLGFAKKDDSVLVEINLGDLADEAAQLVHREAANKNIEIVQEIEPDIGTIWSDPYQLRQVLINLLTNAIHATGSGGRITIIIAALNGEINLTVQDNGQGIPKENLDKIFEPFFSTKSPGKGTGLGLFVTRNIIEKLCGTIEVESRLGHGTRFCIRLPRYCEIKEDLDQDERIPFLDNIAKQKGSTQ
jgi:two-component system NtrC family sensor kinase